MNPRERTIRGSLLGECLKKAYQVLPAVVLCFLSSLPSAQPAETLEHEAVDVQFDRSLRPVAAELVRIFPGVKRELEETFRTQITFRPLVVLMADSSGFRQAAGSGLIAAVAYGPEKLIIIDNSKMKRHPFTLEITLRHELCHLLLANIMEGKTIPRWLNEGVCQWVTGGVSELIMDESRDLLRQAVLAERIMPLDQLTTAFPGDAGSFMLAYQQSRSFVQYMINEFGVDAMLEILANLQKGSGIHEAVGSALPISLFELERAWHDHLRTSWTWLTYLSTYLYPFLFSFAAMALVYGFIRFLIRKRAYRDEEEEDDESW